MGVTPGRVWRALYLVVAAVLVLIAGAGPAHAGPDTPRAARFAQATVMWVAAPDAPAAAAPPVTGAPQPVELPTGTPAELDNRTTSYNRSAAGHERNAQPLVTQGQALEQRGAAWNAKAETFNTGGAAISARVAAHNQKVAVLQGRIAAHNAKRRVFQLPREAGAYAAYQAEANQLNGERTRLQTEQRQIEAEQKKLDAEKTRLAAEKTRLEAELRQLTEQISTWSVQGEMLAAERQLLLQQLSSVLQSRQVARPRPVAAPRGGDAGRPVGAAGPRAPASGGDAVSGTSRTGPLGEYAKAHDVEVDQRPAEALLTPEAVAKVPAREAAALPLTRTFDGLVRVSDGKYRALYVRNPATGSTPTQRSFDEAIRRGGRATAIVDGRKITITEVEPVDGPATPAADDSRHNLALGLGDQVRLFAGQRGHEHLMDVAPAVLRQELVGRLANPNYRFHVRLAEFSPTDYPNVLARGRYYDEGRRGIPVDGSGDIRPEARDWERAPGVTDWEMYLLHTVPGALERTTFYDAHDNVVPDPFLEGRTSPPDGAGTGAETGDDDAGQASPAERQAWSDARGLLGADGTFTSPEWEKLYQDYVARKVKAGELARDRVDWKVTRDYWLNDSPMARGNRFNAYAGERFYDFNEVHLANGKRVDSYRPPEGGRPGEIVSRKATDFDIIALDTFKEYLSELRRKYSPGTVIQSDKYRELRGKPLEGNLILEVPDSNLNATNRIAFEEMANSSGIEIRYRPEG
ncbi:hypothetical protein [Micromonospora arborensis]|uniref:hypothetical protein n=1 Tax=Micromonospora arborensis TaxID=2116518 RepID=UPI00372355AE